MSEPLQFKSINEDFWFEGYLSTGTIDLVNDKVTQECMEDMCSQILNSPISVKLSIEHDAPISDMRLIPPGKFVEAKVDGDKLFVKGKLNKHHPEFNKIKGSIEDGFLDSFSIEFKPLEFGNANIDGKSVRVLKKVFLGGGGLTGRPINQECQLTNFYMKSVYAYGSDEKATDESCKQIPAQNENKSKPPLGSGGRFAELVGKLSKRGVKDPKALAATIGRKKYGKKKFQKLAEQGKSELMNPSDEEVEEFIDNDDEEISDQEIEESVLEYDKEVNSMAEEKNIEDLKMEIKSLREAMEKIKTDKLDQAKMEEIKSVVRENMVLENKARIEANQKKFPQHFDNSPLTVKSMIALAYGEAK